MMSKRDARALALTGKLTWGDLLAKIEARPLTVAMSKLNPSLTVEYVRSLFRCVCLAENPAEVPDISRDRGSTLIRVTNILREFGP